MENSQVVVITGKLCSGKTELAKLLKEEFNFEIIPKKSSLADLEPIIKEINDSINNKKSLVVVDHLNSTDQVTLFRKKFGNNLIHVHLYAANETLHERYQKVGDDYDTQNYLSDEKEIIKLKHDADVRIDTTRSDQKDTLVRVAARLHLFTPPSIRCVDVLIGGQYGSEGKGNVVSYLAREYDVIVRVGGPNAGHTVSGPNGTFTYHHLPSGSRDVNAKLLLGPGMTIHVEGLLQEIEACSITPDRLCIDPQAAIITDDYKRTENDNLVSTIASTGSGSGVANARRILDRGSNTFKMAKDIPELKPFIKSTTTELEKAYRENSSILLEGTQGSGLSIFHGEYPYVTSRDTNVAGCLAEAGISPSRIRKILMVIRTMPIRVGNPEGSQNYTSGPLKHETSFNEIAKKASLDSEQLNSVEKTSTTKRNRRVGWFEWEQYRKACALNAPTDIVLTFVDYINVKNSNARRFEQLDSETIKFIEELERVAQAPVSLISTRFPRTEEGAEDFRSLIDRRNWTACLYTLSN